MSERNVILLAMYSVLLVLAIASLIVTHQADAYIVGLILLMYLHAVRPHESESDDSSGESR